MEIAWHRLRPPLIHSFLKKRGTRANWAHFLWRDRTSRECRPHEDGPVARLRHKQVHPPPIDAWSRSPCSVALGLEGVLLEVSKARQLNCLFLEKTLYSVMPLIEHPLATWVTSMGGRPRHQWLKWRESVEPKNAMMNRAQDRIYLRVESLPFVGRLGATRRSEDHRTFPLSQSLVVPPSTARAKSELMNYLKPFPALQLSLPSFGSTRAVWSFFAVFLVLFTIKATAQDALLNASYDVSRELYRDINASFAADWKARTGRSVEIRQSHAGSSVQARAVIDGLEADVATFNQVTDLEALVDAKLVSKDWQTKYPYNASPCRSIMTFIVRHGNPKGIKNWDDLAKPGMQIALANPKTSGNGRYAYLSAYGYALKTAGGDEAAALEFMKKFYANVPVMDTGGRGATSTFAAAILGMSS